MQSHGRGAQTLGRRDCELAGRAARVPRVNLGKWDRPARLGITVGLLVVPAWRLWPVDQRCRVDERARGVDQHELLHCCAALVQTAARSTSSTGVTRSVHSHRGTAVSTGDALAAGAVQPTLARSSCGGRCPPSCSAMRSTGIGPHGWLGRWRRRSAACLAESSRRRSMRGGLARPARRSCDPRLPGARAVARWLGRNARCCVIAITCSRSPSPASAPRLVA